MPKRASSSDEVFAMLFRALPMWINSHKRNRLRTDIVVAVCFDRKTKLDITAKEINVAVHVLVSFGMWHRFRTYVPGKILPDNFLRQLCVNEMQLSII